MMVSVEPAIKGWSRKVKANINTNSIWVNASEGAVEDPRVTYMNIRRTNDIKSLR